MADSLLKLSKTNNWIAPGSAHASFVALRMSKGAYAISPAPLPDSARQQAFATSIKQLNAEVILTITSSAAATITSGLNPDQNLVVLSPRRKLQVVETYEDLAEARFAQMACFVRREAALVVWCDRVDDFEKTAKKWEEKLTSYVWRQANGGREKVGDVVTEVRQTKSSDDHTVVDEFDEKNMSNHRIEVPRPTLYYNTVYIALAVGLSQSPSLTVGYSAIVANFSIHSKDVFACSLFARTIMREYLLDGYYLRFALLAVLPFMFMCIMFVCDTIIGVIAQVVMPIRQMGSNSLYYSGVPPVQLEGTQLPHFTVIMPVCDLDEVLAPSIESVSRAIRNYELQGGTASILVCEDGMQLVEEKEMLRRKDFYERFGCNWVARHPENRAGRFKKSSNMNKAMALSLRVEDLMDQERPTNLPWSQRREDELYARCLSLALDEHEGRIWAEGNIRIGDYILLIDSDTRIPQDCFLDAASEMEGSPEVGVLQHCSGTFLLPRSLDQLSICACRIVNFSISWSVANGASGPFVGHNAFLRWSALQHQAFYNKGDAIWSENHVSEDFVMSLNLNRAGYIVRWATYSKGEFLEGVSLTINDELNRWQKYAFGCSEMVFHPIYRWLINTPFTKLYASFLWSNVPLASKFSTSSYVASYWAIAAAAPLLVALYVVQGLFWDEIDLNAFVLPFSNIIGCLIFFTAGSTFGLIAARYRSQDADLLTCLKQHLCWTPFLAFFFGGLSWHVFTALVAHITHYPMTWSTTVKEVGSSTVFKEIPKLLKRFWACYLVMFSLLAAVIIMTTNLLPLNWQVHDLVIIFPACWFAGFQ
ncbi:hypothetical protein T439DRAFT_284745 [Meredithblackwellia eburnea MCA 4105]